MVTWRAIIEDVRIDFHYIHIEPTPTLEVHAQKTFDSLAHLISGLDPAGAALLKLEFARSTQHHNKGMVYQAKAQLVMPKQTFRAEADAEDMHAALDALKHTLVRLVERHKEQVQKHHAA